MRIKSGRIFPFYFLPMKKTAFCDLQSCAFCRGCLKEWIPALDANRKTEQYSKGNQIFKEGDAVKGLYFVVSGKVKVYRKWGEDKSLIMRFVKPGEIFGHRGMGEKHYPVSAAAIENAVVCFIEYSFFISSLKVNHQYAFDLLQFFAEELQESERKMTYLAHMPVKGRIAYCLVKLKEKFGLDKKGCLNIAISRNDIASYAGTTYETAFRTMSEMIDNGMVAFHEKKIILSDISALELCYKEENIF